MIQIRPITDLKTEYPKIENLVVKEGQTVYLTKNGYGNMVIMSLEKYSDLIEYEDEQKQTTTEEETDMTFTQEEVMPTVKRVPATKSKKMTL